MLIEQQLMIDVTGNTFPELMRKIVFDKLRMNGKVVPGKWHIYPEMVAGGLWTTPSDLAKFGIEVALSKQGKSNRVLSVNMTREMLKPQMPRVEEIALGNMEHRDRMGLGFFLGDETRPDLFGHIGDDEGFKAMLMMFGDSGQGEVIMANSPFGIRLGDTILDRLAQEYGWKEYVLFIVHTHLDSCLGLLL